MRQIKEVVFWVLSAIALIVIFGRSYGGYINSFFFVSFLMPVIVGTSYAFSSFLVPNYLLKKKYFKFSLYTAYTIIVSLNLEMLVITLAFSVLAEYRYELLNPAAKNIFVLTITMYFIALLKAFTMLIKNSFSVQDKISVLEEKQNTNQEGFLIVRSDRKNVKVLLAEILFIESLSDYVKINLKDKSVITKEKISNIEEKVSMPFLRTHRSFIVNTDKITSFSAETIEIGETKLPVSRTYKKDVQQLLKKK
jgi:two-component system response regulator LytT